MADPRQPFYFVENTLRVLTVDDDPKVRGLLTQYAGQFGIFETVAASSAREGARILDSGTVHACTLDLGLSDVDRDEYWLLREYANKVAICVLTGSTSPEKGAQCLRHGAYKVFDKRGQADLDAVFGDILDASLVTMFYPQYRSWNTDAASKVLAALLQGRPESVSEWAAQADISGSRLRMICEESFHSCPKHIVLIASVYRAAFSYNTPGRHSPGAQQALVFDQREYGRMHDSYLLHYNDLRKLLKR